MKRSKSHLVPTENSQFSGGGGSGVAAAAAAVIATTTVVVSSHFENVLTCSGQKRQTWVRTCSISRDVFFVSHASFVCLLCVDDKRGRVLLPAFWDRLSEGCEEVEGLTLSDDDIKGKVKKAEGYFKEVSESRKSIWFFFWRVGGYQVRGEQAHGWRRTAREMGDGLHPQ